MWGTGNPGTWNERGQIKETARGGRHSREKRRSSAFGPPRSGFVQVVISGVPAASNVRVTLPGTGWAEEVIAEEGLVSLLIRRTGHRHDRRGRATAASGRRYVVTSAVLAGLLLRQPFQRFAFIISDHTRSPSSARSKSRATMRRLLAELHRDSLYPMMGKDPWVAGLTVGKPQGRSLCVWGVASGSAASHPDPGSSAMVEFSEESPKATFLIVAAKCPVCGDPVCLNCSI